MSAKSCRNCFWFTTGRPPKCLGKKISNLCILYQKTKNPDYVCDEYAMTLSDVARKVREIKRVHIARETAIKKLIQKYTQMEGQIWD